MCDNVCVWNNQITRGEKSYRRTFKFLSLHLSTSPLALTTSQAYIRFMALMVMPIATNLFGILVKVFLSLWPWNWLNIDLYPLKGKEGYNEHVVQISLQGDTILWFRNCDGYENCVFVPRRSRYLCVSRCNTNGNVVSKIAPKKNPWGNNMCFEQKWLHTSWGLECAQSGDVVQSGYNHTIPRTHLLAL